MALPLVRLNACVRTPAFVNVNNPTQTVPDCVYRGTSEGYSAATQDKVSHTTGLQAIERLRKRLDAIDEHTREIRSARHILLRREQLLVQERDELVECLNSIEVAFLTKIPAYPNSSLRPVVPHDDVTSSIRCKFKLPNNKRRAISDSSDRPTVRKSPFHSDDRVNNMGVSNFTPLASLETEPTLIMECPSHLLEPSKSLPRPPPSPVSFVKTSGSSSWSPRMTRGVTRFSPGSSTPRIGRSRSSSPLTQMLPPPVRPSPKTPVPTKGYNPVIRDLAPIDFKTSSSVAHTNSAETRHSLVPESNLQPESTHQDDNPDYPSTRLSGPQKGSIPIYLMLNSSSSGWSLTHMGPERTPSPLMSTPSFCQTEELDLQTKCEELKKLAESKDQDTREIYEKASCNLDGPASRTRARVSGAGAGACMNKGKMRA
ncbi:hypothetical protein RhiTH_006212 [Rhizoctonia solani]